MVLATRLLPALCDSLEQQGEGARRIIVNAYRVDGSVRRTGIGTSRPTRNPDHLARLLAPHIAALDPGFGVDAMSLIVSAADAMGPAQAPLAGVDDATAGFNIRFGELLDRLGNRLDAVEKWTPVKSHWPERAVRRVSFPDLSVTGEPMIQPGWRRLPARPLRFLDRPEPVATMALLPDYPPRRLIWRGRSHEVIRADGPERLAEEWWRAPASSGVASEAAREDLPSVDNNIRDYYRLELADGRRLWVFRAGMPGNTPSWYLHGAFA